VQLLPQIVGVVPRDISGIGVVPHNELSQGEGVKLLEGVSTVTNGTHSPW